jgi:4-amino-4-deoxy-L-arabinose transferase-like glycosyltransferase
MKLPATLTLRLAQGVVILIFLILGIALSVTAPFNEGPDEVAHFQFSRFIARYSRLPTTWEERAEAGYKSDWPPLFYLIVGFIGQGIDLDSPPYVKVAQNNPRLQLVVGHENIIGWRALTTEDPYQGEVLLWYLGRWLTLLCGAVGIGATYLLVRVAYPQYSWLALSAAALLGFLPTYLHISGVISYEPLLGAVLAFYFLVLFYTIQHPERGWLYLGLGLLMGLAGLTKYTPLPAMPILPLLVVWLGYRQKWGWRTTMQRLGLVSLGLLLTAGGWFIYVLVYFNRVAELGWVKGVVDPFLISDGSDATSMRLANLITDVGLDRADIRYDDSFWIWLWRNMNWGGREFAWLLVGLWALALAGFMRQWRNRMTERQRLWVLVVIGHILLFMALPFLRFLLTRQAATGMSQHILFPAGAAAIVLTVQGMSVWLHPRYLTLVLSIVAVVYLGLGAASIPETYAQPWPVQTVPLSDNEQVLATFETISLIGYEQTVDNDTLKVTLQWRAEDFAVEDYWIELTLQDREGQPWVRWVGQPLNGRYPTRAWAPGDRLREVIYLPIAGLPAEDYQLHLHLLNEFETDASDRGKVLSLSRFRLNPPAMLGANNLFVGDREVRYAFWPDKWAKGAMPTYREDENTQPITSAFSGTPQSPISNLHLTLYWRAETPLTLDYTTFVHIRNSDGEIVAQSDHVPFDGAYPTGLWHPGDIIADKAVIPLGAQILAGEYSLVVGMYDFNTGERLAVPDTGNNEVILTRFEVGR